MVIRKSYVYALAFAESIMVGRESRSRVWNIVQCVKTSNKELCYMTKPNPNCWEASEISREGEMKDGKNRHTLQRSTLCGPSCTCIRTPFVARVRNDSPRYHGTDTAMSFPKSQLSVPLPWKW